jgi:hypothetical protein
MKTPICFNSNGNDVIIWCSLNVWSCIFWVTIIATCVVVINVRYTIYVRFESTMIMSIKVQKLFLVIRISIHHCVMKENVGDLLLTCVPFSKVVVMRISWSVSWVVVHSFPQRNWSKWVRRSSMVWPHSHCERWATVGCGKPKWVHDVVRKWVKDKQNAGVVGQTSN